MRRYLVIILISLNPLFLKAYVADTTISEVREIIDNLHSEAYENFKIGNFIEYRNIYLKIIGIKERLDSNDRISLGILYQNMGLAYSAIWDYEKALEYYDKAEKIFTQENDLFQKSTIMFNKGFILSGWKEYEQAYSFFDAAINVSDSLKVNERSYVLFYGYLHYSQTLSLEGKFDSAISYLDRVKNFIDNDKYRSGLVDKEYANLYRRMKRYKDAKKYYVKSLDKLENEKDKFIPYLEYGNILLGIKEDFDLAEIYLQKALNIYERYDLESPVRLAFVYQNIGYYNEMRKNFQQALRFYQKSIVLYTDEPLKDTSLFVNPTKISSINIIRTLESLKSKSRTLYKMYIEEKDTFYLNQALKTSTLVLEIINNFRYRFTSESSNFLISDQEKLTFDFAEQLALELFNKTGDVKFIKKGFEINEMGKAFCLLTSIRNQRATEYGGIPIKILAQEKELNRKLSFYEEKIFEEKQKSLADDEKIKKWQIQLFDLEQEYAKFTKRLEKEFPDYYALKYENKVTSLDEIQQKLSDNTSLVEYSLHDTILHIYYANRHDAGIVSVPVDTGFENICMKFFRVLTKQSFGDSVMSTYREYTKLAYELYKTMVIPVEGKLKAENLIIIPDGKISYIPFDALVTSHVDTTKLNYMKMPFLLKRYSTGYSYSSTLHFNPIQHNIVPDPSVLAFAPFYEGKRSVPGTSLLLSLPGVKDEVKEISGLVKTRSFMDYAATESNFKKYSDQYRILHLAMHTIIDDENPMYSRLAFTDAPDTLNDNFLHTYEIYNMKFNASLAVLSSCASGYGKIQEGEGIQSLARSFAYAGCPSILMTLWEVSDMSTVTVMDKFYTYLKDHDSKPSALRKAKIDFLEGADQLRSNPFFWSSYVIIGDSTPIFPLRKDVIAANIFLLTLPLFYTGYIVRKQRKRKKKIYR